MKIKVYTVYHNGEIEKQFIRRDKARKYVEELKYWFFNEDDDIYYRKEYIYV